MCNYIFLNKIEYFTKHFYYIIFNNHKKTYEIILTNNVKQKLYKLYWFQKSSSHNFSTFLLFKSFLLK